MFNVALPFVPFSWAQLGLRSSKHQDFSPSNELKRSQMFKNSHIEVWSLHFPAPSLASGAGQGSGQPPADFFGPGTWPTGVSDAAGPVGPGAARAAGAEDPVGEGEAAGPERAASLGPRRRTVPAPPQAGWETSEWMFCGASTWERGGGRVRIGSHLNTSCSDSRGAAAGEACGKDAEGSSQGRPQDQRPEPQRGPRGPDLQVRRGLSLALFLSMLVWYHRVAPDLTRFLPLVCFQREDGLLHTSKDQHPQPAGWRRVEKHFKVFPLSLTLLYPTKMKYITGEEF